MNAESSQPPVVVRYPYVVSLFVCTLRFESREYLIRSTDARYLRGIPYLFVSLLLGWWGVPWGPIHTWEAVWECLRGGSVNG